MSTVSLIRNVDSPNFDKEEISVDFLVVHYTACSLEKTLEIFTDRAKKVCAHFVINTDGALYDLGRFWNGPIRRGAHAGVSRYEMDGKIYEKFNEFSIGVELVNFNGNYLDFPKAQYVTLSKLIRHMSDRFVLLNDPNRIVGHEHIAGFRGKIDPGLRFDWKQLYSLAYPGEKAPERNAVLTAADLKAFEASRGAFDPGKMSPDEWMNLSSEMEAFIGNKPKV